MLVVYDKIQWHLNEDHDMAINRMKTLLSFLNEKGLLSEEGKEILEFGVDESTSVHERMLTDDGKDFMDACYDKALGSKNFSDALSQEYSDWRAEA